VLKATYDIAFVQEQSLCTISRWLLAQGACREIVAMAHLPAYGGFSYFDRADEEWRQQREEAALYRAAGAVVVPSAFAADILYRVHRLDASRVTTIPLGPLATLAVGQLAPGATPRYRFQ